MCVCWSFSKCVFFIGACLHKRQPIHSSHSYTSLQHLRGFRQSARNYSERFWKHVGNSTCSHSLAPSLLCDVPLSLIVHNRGTYTSAPCHRSDLLCNRWPGQRWDRVTEKERGCRVTALLTLGVCNWNRALHNTVLTQKHERPHKST